MKATALVTGGSGAIGPVLVEQLVDSGYEVRVLVRRSLPQQRFPTGVQEVVGDITDAQSVQVAARGADVIFHLAAKLHLTAPGGSLRSEYQDVNIGGTRNMVEAAQREGVRRLVFFSTISVYGPTKPWQIFDEAAPLRPQTIYAETKCRAEELVMSMNHSSSEGVVLRLAAVYGPRVKGNYAQLLSALRRGRFIPIGTGHNRRTLVYDRDVASAALIAGQHPAAAGTVYNVTDGDIHTFNEIMNAMCSALGRPAPRLHLPLGPMRAVAGSADRVFEMLNKRSPAGRATIDKLIEDVAVSGEKIQRELDFRPAFDLVSGWQATAEAMLA